MIVITKRQRASQALGLYEKQYKPEFIFYDGSVASEKIKDLKALGVSPSPDDVDRVIGNTSWTECRCSECQETVNSVVLVGEEPDYESSTVYLCLKCAVAAAEILKAGVE